MKSIRFIWICIFVLCFHIYKANAQDGKDDEKTIPFSLRDIYPFETAADMYDVALKRTMNETAEKLVKDISAQIDKGVKIENAAVWEKLIQLEPYRMNDAVQDAVKIWVETSVKNLPKTESTATARSLVSISKAYKEKNFAKAISESLTALNSAPNHYDIRSNLALALMHTQKDLCAQIELEILTKQKSDHIPGLINLTVLYERMNNISEAERIAEELIMLEKEKNFDVPLIRFNAAWFLNGRGEYGLADEIMNDPKMLNDTTIKKYNTLRQLNRKQLEYENSRVYIKKQD